MTGCLQVSHWLPQNDVLGHQQTKAFLSHCGANSLYEAAYHGVPIVALPFFAGKGSVARARHMALWPLSLNNESMLL